MASMPPLSTQRSDSNNSGQDAPSSSLNHGSSSPSMTSEDSQTVLLNNPSSTETKAEPPSAEPPPLSRSSTLGIKKCWICICDSTEDDPAKPEQWRSPCTCNLTAHESCLLDWVADLENPKTGKRSPPPSKILCPQCKSEIKIARPKSYVVDGVRVLDRALGTLVLPGIGISLLGTIWAGAYYHGLRSVWLVFGPEEAARIFLESATRHPTWLAGYPLIPLSLIFSRTSYADFVLPSGSVFLAATQIDGFQIDTILWPPLPSTVFACLPLVKTGYNWIYEKAFGALNKQWINVVQPRQQERAEGQDGNEADAEVAADAVAQEADQGGIVLELQVNIEAEEEVEAPAGEGIAADGAGANAEARPAGDGGARNQGQAGVAHQVLGQRQDEIIEGTSGIGQSALGALLFPAVAASMGGILGFTLPTSWVSGSSNYMNGRPGILRSRWGRSVVGGCLFVVLKDALVLYCRWKMAQTHRKRKVLDYDKTKKEYWLSTS